MYLWNTLQITQSNRSLGEQAAQTINSILVYRFSHVMKEQQKHIYEVHLPYFDQQHCLYAPHINQAICNNSIVYV